MKLSIQVCITCLLFCMPCVGAEMDKEAFFKKYPQHTYQDIIIHNQLVSFGTVFCEPRYNVIRPILDLFERPFSVLDLGAAQGYFSYSISRDYPHSFCVMIDANVPLFSYSQHGDMLFDLCKLNAHLDNICYLNKTITLPDLVFLNQNEHFDVIIAFLVVHLMYTDLKDQIQVIENLLDLGDNLILEVANNVAVPFTDYVKTLSKTMECLYLGEVKRRKNPDSLATGKLFWFKKSKPHYINHEEEDHMIGLKKETFLQLNGVYPENVR